MPKTITIDVESAQNIAEKIQNFMINLSGFSVKEFEIEECKNGKYFVRPVMEKELFES